MKKHFVMGFVGLAMVASFAGCVAPDDGAQVDEAASSLSMGGRVWDFNTLCTVGGVQMHCCPAGTAMVGIHVNDNVLDCAFLEAGFTTTRILDAGTNRNDMHACPFGYLMVGVHVQRDLLACQQSGQAISLEFVDALTTDSYPMHVCPNSFAMGGIRVDRNQFTCDQ